MYNLNNSLVGPLYQAHVYTIILQILLHLQLSISMVNYFEYRRNKMY